MSNPFSPLRLNVGFIVHQTIGYSREFYFELPKISLPPDLLLLDLSGTARVTRTPQGLLVQVKAEATISTQCVRCLGDISQHLDADFADFYAFTKRNVTESNLILPEDGHIDLEPLLREYLLIEIPINPLCRPDCKGLCPVCGENLNETTCNHNEEAVDPRLAKLKAFLEK